MLIKILANWGFAVILNGFTGIKCFFNVQLSPQMFFYLFKSNLKRVNLRNGKLGRGVILSEGCSLFNQAEAFGKVEIGRFTSISGPSTRICAEVNKVKIGAFCSIASNVIIQEFYHNYNKTTTYNVQSNILKKNLSGDEKISKGSILIEDDVWIGSNSVILSGVKIGRGAIIGAGSVVTKDVDAYTIVAGNPAKKIRERFSKGTIDYLEESKWWLWEEKKIKENLDFFTIDRF